MKRTFLGFSLIVAIAFSCFGFIAFTKNNKLSLREKCSAAQKQNEKAAVQGDFLIWDLATSLLATTQ